MAKDCWVIQVELFCALTVVHGLVSNSTKNQNPAFLLQQQLYITINATLHKKATYFDVWSMGPYSIMCNCGLIMSELLEPPRQVGFIVDMLRSNLLTVSTSRTLAKISLTNISIRIMLFYYCCVWMCSESHNSIMDKVISRPYNLIKK